MVVCYKKSSHNYMGSAILFSKAGEDIDHPTLPLTGEYLFLSWV